jgi:hypothetical protein
MKSRFYTSIFALIILVFQNCQNQEIGVRQDSIYKGEILEYISSYKEAVPNSQISKIIDVAAAIDFKRVEIYKLRTTEKVIMADMKTIEGFKQPNAMKALFFVNQGKIVRSNVVTFNNGTLANEYDQAALAVLNGTTPKAKFSGKVSLFNLLGELVLFNNFNNGALDGVGFVRSYNTGKNNGRSGSCTDWYLVSYYPNGNVTREYVFTTCDYGCEFYRVGRTNCGGGGCSGANSGGGVEFPANPANGATYEYTDKNGEYTKYQYDASAYIWKVVEKILPAAVVVAKRDEYHFLDLDWPGAYHGQIVLGTDNFIYTFGSDGNWKGEPAYLVDGEDNGSNEIPNVSEYLKCFNSSIGGEVTIYVDQPISDSSAPFFLTDVGHSWIGITQKTNGLSVTRLLGFYPKTSANPFDPSDDGKFKDDSPRDFDVSITFDFTPNQMSDLLAFIRGPIQDYHLNENNCTNFVVDAFSKSSISLPETIGYWPNNGQGLNPGNFGQDMRNYQGTFKSRNTSGGKPSGVSGNCN